MSDQITDKQRAEYFQRSFAAIDGVWFMIREQESDFDTALELDRKVWEIVPKIQARKLREIFGIEGKSLEALARALNLKFTMEDYDFSYRFEDNGNLVFEIKVCPWLKLMEKSGRMDKAGPVGRAIGEVEYNAWAREFGDGIIFRHEALLCEGAESCVMKFLQNRQPKPA